MADEFELDEVEDAFDRELANGLSRREALRRAAVAGASLGGLALLGPSVAGARPALARRAVAGGTLRLAFQSDTNDIEPFSIGTDSGVTACQQVLEPLVWANADLVPRPLLAQSFAPVNGNAAKWRFTLRRGVKYTNGQPFTADDVIAWFDKLVAPDSTSNAKGVLGDVLPVGGSQKVDDYTIIFNLKRPVAKFPLRVSNYLPETGIPPKTYQVGTFTKNPVGTGPFVMKQFTPRQSITLVKNPNYWQQGLPYLDGIEIRDLELPAQVVAMQAGDLDVMPQAPLLASQALLGNPKFAFSFARSAGYREIGMRVDKKPFTDKRVRQALAYSLDRPKLIQGLLKGHGELGNDHLLAPVYGLNVKLPQRKQNYRKARQLLAAAGYPDGFKAKLTAQNDQELPQYVALIQQMVKPAGINLSLNILDDARFYGAPGKGEPWLEDIVVGAPWNSRPTPGQQVWYQCDVTFNQPHWCNRRFTNLSKGLDAAVDAKLQQKIAQEMATIMHDQVPALIAYWVQLPRVRSVKVKGLPITSTIHVDARRVTVA